MRERTCTLVLLSLALLLLVLLSLPLLLLVLPLSLLPPPLLLPLCEPRAIPPVASTHTLASFRHAAARSRPMPARCSIAAASTCAWAASKLAW